MTSRIPKAEDARPGRGDKGVERLMDRALAEAGRGLGLTSPNPVVGAVVVRDGVEIACGFHECAGGAHAEVRALRQAGGAARGADLYVTLEPCWTSGRTPPCTTAILEAGIRRVFVGCLDANPKHAGAGVALLREEGVEVRMGVRESECRRINEAFFHWVSSGRPFVILKMAMTLDGKIATAGGQSRWITGVEARSDVQLLRRSADAIMVGGETVRCDDPSLCVREPANWPRQPQRFVWTRRGEADFDAGLRIRSPGSGRRTRFVRPAGAAEWRAFLEDLGKEQLTVLLVEGGGELAAEVLRSGAVDKLVWYIAPKILGGRNSRPAVGGPDPAALADSVALTDLEVSFLGDDLKCVAYRAQAKQSRQDEGGRSQAAVRQIPNSEG